MSAHDAIAPWRTGSKEIPGPTCLDGKPGNNKYKPPVFGNHLTTCLETCIFLLNFCRHIVLLRSSDLQQYTIISRATQQYILESSCPFVMFCCVCFDLHAPVFSLTSKKRRRSSFEVRGECFPSPRERHPWWSDDASSYWLQDQQRAAQNVSHGTK